MRSLTGTWNPFEDNSWQLYFHSLRMVSFLVNAYDESQNEAYLKKAMSITKDWIEKNPDDDSVSNWAWADHAVSNRILNLTNLYERLQNSSIEDIEFVKLLLLSLYEHAIWQADEENYLFAHNHGVMQDRSLIQVAHLFDRFEPSEDWYQLSIERLTDQFQASVSKSGVHLEHSPGYHIHTYNLFQEIDEALATKGDTLGSTVNESLEDMRQYLAYVYKPDGRLPLVGDTVSTELETIDHIEHDYLTYIRTNGTKGDQPQHSSVVYEDAGVAILRDKWKKGENFKDSTYIMLSAGYHSHVHKHADDLSFVLYSMGEDIFMDSGKYMYKNNPMREYMRSALSHNTVTVDGGAYPLDPNKRGVFIKDSEITEEYDRVVAEHSLYEGVTFTREMIFLKPNILVLLDTLVAEEEHSYEQRFNLNPNATLNEFNQDGMSALIKEDLEVYIKQLDPVDEVNHFKGSEDPIRGFISYTTNELTPVDHLEFIKNGVTAEFITVVEMKSHKYVSPIDGIEIDQEYLMYTQNNEQKKIKIQ